MTDVPDRLRSTVSGHYTIERELGPGGVATVYQAHDMRQERKVAQEVLSPEQAALTCGELPLKIRTTANLRDVAQPGSSR